ncbi:MAG: PDZ domain-containing protein [Dokdonella sp.]
MTRGDAGLGYCRRGVLLLLGLCVSLAGWAGGDVYAADVDAHATAASTASANTPKAADVVEQRLRSELRLLLLDLVQSGAFGDVPVERISLDLAMPTERLSTLGVLVDSRSGENAMVGLRVLGTTPGSLAESVGMRAGDIILSCNGISLVGRGNDADGSARAASELRRQFASLADGAAIRFNVRRGEQELVIDGIVRTTQIPAVHLRLGEAAPSWVDTDTVADTTAAGGCGRISVVYSAPTQRGLHPLKLISIDDRHFPFDGQSSFRVSAGTHVITVAENVDSRYLSFNNRLRDNQGPSRYKSLTIDVKADTTYRLATRVIPEHRNEWRDGAWWEPVVWSESSEACR